MLNYLKTTESSSLLCNLSDREDLNSVMNLSVHNMPFGLGHDKNEGKCLSQGAVDAFLSLFAGRESAHLPYYYTDADLLSKTAGALSGVLSTGGSLVSVVSGATGGLASRIIDGADPCKTAKEDVIALRMNTLCHPQPFVSICLDLMMYEDNKLFASALEAYVSFFMEIDTVIDSLDDVQVLKSKDETILPGSSEEEDTVTTTEATSVKNHLALLQFQIDAFETWGEDTEFSTFDESSYANVVRYLRSVTNFLLLSGGGEFVEPDDIRHSQCTEVRQNIMFNYRAHETMQEILEIESGQKGLDSTTHRLKDFAIAFLILFVQENPTNQLAVHDALLDFLVENIMTLEDAPELLAAIFKGNTHLSRRVPRSLLQKLMEVNYLRWKDGLPPKSDYLELFEAIVYSDQAPNPENQKLVLEVMTDGPFEELLFSAYWRSGFSGSINLSSLTESIATMKSSRLNYAYFAYFAHFANLNF
jgi:hypothetical protein